MLHVFVYTAYPILSNYAQHKVTSVCVTISMKWAGDTKCSSRARQLTPGRQPVAAAQHRAAVRAAAVLLVLLQQHRARSAVDGAVN